MKAYSVHIKYGFYGLFMACSGFFTSALGLVVISYYKDIMESFGLLYAIILAMVVPNVAYMVPGWSPPSIRVIPTYYMLESFKEILLGSDALYVIISSVVFLLVGAVLFTFANYRFKRTLLM